MLLFTDDVRADDSTQPLPGGGHADPPHRLTLFQQHVVAVVAALEPGDLLTYGEVALEAGHPGAGQAVANVLRRVPGLPWWRVLPTNGRLYRQHREVAEPLLIAEGHRVDESGRVVPSPSPRTSVTPHDGRAPG